MVIDQTIKGGFRFRNVEEYEKAPVGSQESPPSPEEDVKNSLGAYEIAEVPEKRG